MADIPINWKISLSNRKQPCNYYDDLRAAVRVCQKCCKHVLEIEENIY